MKCLAMIFLTMAVLAGCAQKTQYAKQAPLWTGPFGYRDMAMGDDEFAVIVEGNRHSSPDYIRQMALFRAAQITIEQGKRYFTVIHSLNKVIASQSNAPMPMPLPGVGLLIMPVPGRTISEPTSILVFKLLSGEEKGAEDADIILRKYHYLFRSRLLT